ncbi:MAG: methyltransferase domain-containing protein [Thermoplasmata archaeon]|nr:methyltransferase domain-containing protein [Thermoplasmata archaeon]
MNGQRLATVPYFEDRRCRPRFLVSPLRYWIAGPARDLDPLDVRPGHAVADLGAGAGFHAAEILRRIGPQGRLALVDLDPDNLALARARLGNDARVSTLVASAASVDALSSGSFDRVLLSLVLCCLVDKEGVLDQAGRILRPGGRALISYPKRWIRRRGRRAAYAMSPDRWKELMERGPWIEVPIANSLWTIRHLVEKGSDDRA